jgi:peptidyl-Asp metalloendopeptidase
VLSQYGVRSFQHRKNNPAAAAIAATGKELFQLHKNGSIWRYVGVPCANDRCPGWEKLDNNPAATEIAAAALSS